MDLEKNIKDYLEEKLVQINTVSIAEELATQFLFAVAQRGKRWKIKRVGKSWTAVFLAVRLWQCMFSLPAQEETQSQRPSWLSLFESISHLSVHSQTALAVQTSHCSIVTHHAGCHGEIVLWSPRYPSLLSLASLFRWNHYLLEGIYVFLLVTASLWCHSVLLLLLLLHDAHSFILLSRSLTVRIRLAWCFVAINFSVSACQRCRSGPKFPPSTQLSPGHIIAFYYQGLSVTTTLKVRTGSFITAAKIMLGVLTLGQGTTIACVSYRCDFLSLLHQKSQINSF